jgi:hypothetical protein
MLKKICFSFISMFSISQAHSLRIEPYNNFTRFIFEAKDIIANKGNTNDSYWYYTDYNPVDDCAATINSIYLPQKAYLSGYINVRSSTNIWVDSPRDLPNTKLFNVKVFSNSNQEIQSSPFYLSELKDIKILSYQGNGSYIHASTENEEFINSSLVFRGNQNASGKINFCISNIIPKTDVYITSIIIDAIM